MRRPSAPPVGAEGQAPPQGSASSASPSDLPGDDHRAGSPLALVRVPFRGGFLLAAEGHHDQEGDRPVILKPFVDGLGLDLSTQLIKLRGKGWAVVGMIPTTGADGKTYKMASLPLRAIPLWLATINPGKVKPEVRPMLVTYQREAADALYHRFLGGAPAAPCNPPGQPPDVGAQLAALSERLAWVEAGQGGRHPPPRSLTPIAITEPLLRQAWAAIQRRGVWRVTPGRLTGWVRGLRPTERARAALDGLAARGLVRQIDAHHGAAFVVVAATQAAALAAGEGVRHAG